VQGHVARIAVEVFPELPPDATRVPAAEAVVSRLPVAQLAWHIPPGQAGASHRAARFEAQLGAPFRRTAGLVLAGGKPWCNRRPSSIGEQPAYGHARFPSREFGNKT
jgi:hypothetical protein